MHKFRLQFTNKLTQQAYDEKRKATQNFDFIGYCMFYLIIYLVIVLKLCIENSLDQKIVIILIYILVSSIISILLIKYLKNHIYKQQVFIFLIGMINIAAINMFFLHLISNKESESNKNNSEQQQFNLICSSDSMPCILMNLHGIAILFMIEKVCFKMISACIMFTYIYLQSNCLSQLMMILFIVAFLVGFVYAYFFERFKMKLFLKLYEDQTELIDIKNMVKEQFPVGILIFSKQLTNQDKKKTKNLSINFYNKQIESVIFSRGQSSTQQGLQCQSLQQLLPEGNEVKKELTLSSIRHFLENVRCNILSQNGQTITEPVEQKSHNKQALHLKQPTNFIDLVSQYFDNEDVTEINISVEENNYSFTSFLEKNSPHQEQKIKALMKQFKVKLVTCIWDKQQSKIVLIEDVTQKKDYEILQNQSLFKDQILATVTHDLKTPINGMLAQIQSVQNSSTLEQVLKVIDIIKINAQLLLFLVFDIQDFSIMKNGFIKIIPKTFNIVNSVTQCVDLIRYQAHVKKIQIIEQIEQLSSQNLVNNDELRYKQVLINLLSNALKCTYSGYIKIIVRRIIANNLILTIVQDTGIGINEEHQKKLFQMYNNMGHEDKSPSLVIVQQHSVGLGLSISKKLVGLMGPLESLVFHSQENQGSIFSFVINENISNKLVQQSNLNLEQLQSFIQDQIQLLREQVESKNQSIASPNLQQDIAQSLEEQSEEIKSDIQNENGLENSISYQQIDNFSPIQQLRHQSFKLKFNQTENIHDSIKQKIDLNFLIVDDDVFCIQVFRMISIQIELDAKIHIQEAYNGQQAIDLCSKNMFDAVFLDQNMPVMDGAEAAQQIIQINPKTKIFFLTGNGQLQQSNNNSLNQSFNKLNTKCKHVNKPLQKDELKQIFLHLLLKKQNHINQ